MLPLHAMPAGWFATPHIPARLNAASRQVAELKGVASSIPNQGILINTLGLQEAKDSSAIENIITTHDELFREPLADAASGAAKDVARYGQALRVGFDAVSDKGPLTERHILAVQAALEQNRAGYRKLPGTVLKADDGTVVYTPPQDPDDIVRLMGDLERFINDDALLEADPLVKMALIHHQFESIHPFYDGNGRTGRIVCVLYLVSKHLLDIPILYLSRHIVRTKAEYYRIDFPQGRPLGDAPHGLEVSRRARRRRHPRQAEDRPHELLRQYAALCHPHGRGHDRRQAIDAARRHGIGSFHVPRAHFTSVRRTHQVMAGVPPCP